MERGTPQELIEKGGWFHNFANSAEGKIDAIGKENTETERNDEDEADEMEEEDSAER